MILRRPSSNIACDNHLVLLSYQWSLPFVGFLFILFSVYAPYNLVPCGDSDSWFALNGGDSRVSLATSFYGYNATDGITTIPSSVSGNFDGSGYVGSTFGGNEVIYQEVPVGMVDPCVNDINDTYGICGDVDIRRRILEYNDGILAGRTASQFGRDPPAPDLNSNSTSRTSSYTIPKRNLRINVYAPIDDDIKSWNERHRRALLVWEAVNAKKLALDEMISRGIPSLKFHAFYNTAAVFGISTFFFLISSTFLILGEFIHLDSTPSLGTLSFLCFFFLLFLYAGEKWFLQSQLRINDFKSEAADKNLPDSESFVLYGYSSGSVQYLLLILVYHLMIYINLKYRKVEQHSVVLENWRRNAEQGRALNYVLNQVYYQNYLAAMAQNEKSMDTHRSNKSLKSGTVSNSKTNIISKQLSFNNNGSKAPSEKPSEKGQESDLESSDAIFRYYMQPEEKQQDTLDSINYSYHYKSREGNHSTALYYYVDKDEIGNEIRIACNEKGRALKRADKPQHSDGATTSYRRNPINPISIVIEGSHSAGDSPKNERKFSKSNSMTENYESTTVNHTGQQLQEQEWNQAGYQWVKDQKTLILLHVVDCSLKIHLLFFTLIYLTITLDGLWLPILRRYFADNVVKRKDDMADFAIVPRDSRYRYIHNIGKDENVESGGNDGGMLLAFIELLIISCYFKFILPAISSFLTAYATKGLRLMNIYWDRISGVDISNGHGLMSTDHFNNNEARNGLIRTMFFLNFCVDFIRFYGGRIMFLRNITSPILLALLVAKDVFCGLFELIGRWKELDLIFGIYGYNLANASATRQFKGAKPDPFVITKRVQVGLLFLEKMVVGLVPVSFGLPWKYDLDVRLLALENWETLGRYDGPKFPTRTDSVTVVIFANVQMTVRNVPKAIQVYHDYIYGAAGNKVTTTEDHVVYEEVVVDKGNVPDKRNVADKRSASTSKGQTKDSSAASVAKEGNHKANIPTNYRRPVSNRKVTPYVETAISSAKKYTANAKLYFEGMHSSTMYSEGTERNRGTEGDGGMVHKAENATSQGKTLEIITPMPEREGNFCFQHEPSSASSDKSSLASLSSPIASPIAPYNTGTATPPVHGTVVHCTATPRDLGTTTPEARSEQKNIGTAKPVPQNEYEMGTATPKPPSEQKIMSTANPHEDIRQHLRQGGPFQIGTNFEEQVDENDSVTDQIEGHHSTDHIEGYQATDHIEGKHNTDGSNEEDDNSPIVLPPIQKKESVNVYDTYTAPRKESINVYDTLPKGERTNVYDMCGGSAGNKTSSLFKNEKEPMALPSADSVLTDQSKSNQTYSSYSVNSAKPTNLNSTYTPGVSAANATTSASVIGNQSTYRTDTSRSNDYGNQTYTAGMNQKSIASTKATETDRPRPKVTPIDTNAAQAQSGEHSTLEEPKISILPSRQVLDTKALQPRRMSLPNTHITETDIRLIDTLLRSTVQCQLLLRFAARATAKLLGSLLLGLIPLIYAYAADFGHNPKNSFTFWRIHENTHENLIVGDGKKLGVFAKPVYVFSLVYLVFDLLEYCILKFWLRNALFADSGQSTGKEQKSGSSSYKVSPKTESEKAGSLTEEEALHTRKYLETEVSGRFLFIGVVSFVWFFVAYHMHVARNPYNPEIVRQFAERNVGIRDFRMNLDDPKTPTTVAYDYILSRIQYLCAK